MKRGLTILLIILTVLSGAAAPKRSKKKTRRQPPRPAKIEVPAPRTSGTFVTRVDDPKAPRGLDGKNIALWQSHGRYFDANEERWTWQRARLMGTVEDLFPQAFVIPYLVPMLENAGAYVMMPRERDTSFHEVIVDGDSGLAQKGYSETSGVRKWTKAPAVGFAHTKAVLSQGDNPFRAGQARMVETVSRPSEVSTAIWTADLPESGEYALYVSYLSLPNSATDARYTVNSLRGQEVFEINQTMGGGTWVYLGTFPFAKGKSPVVELTNLSDEKDKVVTADAVKIGGGMGNVARSHRDEPQVSGYPRFTEGARYWLQWAGMPASVYAGGKDDYDDDLHSRGGWVNYLSGGSRSNPGQNGLGVPIDLAFAFHTDAGTTPDGYTTIGTLPIVSTAGYLGNGKSKATNARLGHIVSDQIVSDIQSLYDPGWTQRKLRDKSYVEAREPAVPTMLLELLSHQNFADMRYGLDPNFRFDVSRAVYKGILKYLHEVDGVPYVVAPLPVTDFLITGSKGAYTLSWAPQRDPLEATAMPGYYIVYERVDDGAFTELAVVDEPSIRVTPSDSHIYSYRIVAGNDGGRSFPSETLALCDMAGSDAPQVTIVNGFTRISGPTEVCDGARMGFDYADDHGVPYIRDILFTGEQTEFDTQAAWINNDSPGHGASRATHETEVIAGNTFDFVYLHGRAVRAAGHPFISSSVSAFVRAQDRPEIVDLILGKQKEITLGATSATRFKPFTPELKQRLSSLTAEGTALLVSGSYIGSDLFANRFSLPAVAQGDRQFGETVLGIVWRQGKATVTGGVREVRSRYPEFNGRLRFSFNQTLSADCYAVESPESFTTVNPSQGAPVLRYTENDLVAGTAYSGSTHRAVTIGFPFETIREEGARTKLMEAILRFLSEKPDALVDISRRTKVYPGTMITEDDDVTPADDSWAGIPDLYPRDPAVLAGESRSTRRRRRPSA